MQGARPQGVLRWGFQWGPPTVKTIPIIGHLACLACYPAKRLSMLAINPRSSGWQRLSQGGGPKEQRPRGGECALAAKCLLHHICRTFVALASQPAPGCSSQVRAAAGCPLCAPTAPPVIGSRSFRRGSSTIQLCSSSTGSPDPPPSCLAAFRARASSGGSERRLGRTSCTVARWISSKSF